MVATTATIYDRPSCFGFPRGNGMGVPPPANNKGVVVVAAKNGEKCKEMMVEEEKNRITLP
ncbi:hypothetical protein Tco_1021608, partial [Tanacetum coccineum]